MFTKIEEIKDGSLFYPEYFFDGKNSIQIMSFALTPLGKVIIYDYVRQAYIKDISNNFNMSKEDLTLLKIYDEKKVKFKNSYHNICKEEFWFIMAIKAIFGDAVFLAALYEKRDSLRKAYNSKELSQTILASIHSIMLTKNINDVKALVSFVKTNPLFLMDNNLLTAQFFNELDSASLGALSLTKAITSQMCSQEVIKLNDNILKMSFSLLLAKPINFKDCEQSFVEKFEEKMLDLTKTELSEFDKRNIMPSVLVNYRKEFIDKFTDLDIKFPSCFVSDFVSAVVLFVSKHLSKMHGLEIKSRLENHYRNGFGEYSLSYSPITLEQISEAIDSNKKSIIHFVQKIGRVNDFIGVSKLIESNINNSKKISPQDKVFARNILKFMLETLPNNVVQNTQSLKHGYEIALMSNSRNVIEDYVKKVSESDVFQEFIDSDFLLQKESYFIHEYLLSIIDSNRRNQKNVVTINKNLTDFIVSKISKLNYYGLMILDLNSGCNFNAKEHILNQEQTALLSNQNLFSNEEHFIS